MSEDGRFSHAKGRILDNLEIKIGDIFQLDEHRVMCEDTNRRCRMMEITPRHVANIIKRWEEHTGKEAVRIR